MSRVADALHTFFGGILITATAVGFGALGYGCYSLFIVRPAQLAAKEAWEKAQAEVAGAVPIVAAHSTSETAAAAAPLR
jgi:hypothetical protein